MGFTNNISFSIYIVLEELVIRHLLLLHIIHQPLPLARMRLHPLEEGGVLRAHAKDELEAYVGLEEVLGLLLHQLQEVVHVEVDPIILELVLQEQEAFHYDKVFPVFLVLLIYYLLLDGLYDLLRHLLVIHAE